MSKVSIRFFNDREVHAIWDEENSKWWFSAIDIIRAINNEDDYVKAGNYWRWLKKKFATDNIQLVSLTHDFKFQSPDRKKRAADALDYDGVQILAKNFPNNSRYTPIFLADCMILPAKSAQKQSAKVILHSA